MYKRGRERPDTDITGKSNDAQRGRDWSDRDGHKPRNAAKLERLQEVRNRFSPYSL